MAIFRDGMKRQLETNLKKWKDSPLRMPLLLRGARQVGKTYLIEKFGKEEFGSFVSINFEAQPEAIACFSTMNPQEILLKLEKIAKTSIIPGKTLLFLDEIQACPQAIVSMRYFKEKLPQLHLIGAGSLLEFALREENFSFPVGRVQFLYLKPFSFAEFAAAQGISIDFSDTSISHEKHEELMRLVRLYFLIGGMPAAIDAYLSTRSFNECSLVQDILLSTYKADFSKYATEAEQRYLRIIFSALPQTIGEHFKFSKIDPHIKSRELKKALDQLEWAGIFTPIIASSASGIPLSAQLKRNKFKALFLDIGLAQRALHVQPELILDKELTQINQGALSEQFVGGELLTNAPAHQESSLFFWEQEKTGSSAEVDFLVPFQGKIIPVEVKSGGAGKLKSLHYFMKEKKCPLGVVISEKPFFVQNGIVSIPFYWISQLEQIVKNLM